MSSSDGSAHRGPCRRASSSTERRDISAVQPVIWLPCSPGERSSSSSTKSPSLSCHSPWKQRATRMSTVGAISS